MSELAVEGQVAKTAPCCHDLPPQYDSSQPRQDLLTSVIENDQGVRKLFQRMYDLDKEMTKMVENLDNKHFSIENPDWNFLAEYFQESGRKTTEMAQMGTMVANLFKDRTVHNTTELYKALSELDDSELQRAYDSFKRHSTWQMRHELAQNHECSGELQDRDLVGNSQTSSTTKQAERAGDCLPDSSCSCDRLVELSAKMDKINEKLCRSFPSHDGANISKMSVDNTAKPTVGFWKRIFKRSAQL
jgi:hypothetical protein